MSFTKFVPKLRNEVSSAAPAKVAKVVPADRITLAALADPMLPKRRFRRQPSTSWTAEDWLSDFHERVAVAKLEGGQSREVAEQNIFAQIVIEWTNVNPAETKGQDLCAYCGERFGQDEGLPFLNGGGGPYVWLHGNCHDDWMARRRAEAIATISPNIKKPGPGHPLKVGKCHVGS